MSDRVSNSTVTSLDAMRFPLHGSRLIEASAGTGKTFTIATLYLRLLLGHGDEGSAHKEALSVDNILVVTFTEAATAELKSRIRARIHQARLAFEAGESDDPVIQALLAETQDKDVAALQLLDAEREMDTAAIYTIHGFCQRMLVANAFESGSEFQHQFIVDETQLKQQVVNDYWRRNFYSLPRELAAVVCNIWKTPVDLYYTIANYLTGAPLSLKTPPLEGSLQALHRQNCIAIDEIKARWRKECHEVEAVITNSGVKKTTYKKNLLPQWINKISDWAQQTTDDYSVPDPLMRFSQATLSSLTPDGKEVPTLPLFTAIEHFLEIDLDIKPRLSAHAVAQCRASLEKAKHEQHQLSFDDLLARLAFALSGVQGERLAEVIASQFPVALIDEFQDTDALQYDIFRQVYQARLDCGLFMIGDPKQAIYAFRGADIFTYIHARREVSAHYTLETNWRSSHDMIESVNALFSHVDAPFIYRDDIAFLPARPSPKATHRGWKINGELQPAFTTWWHDEQEVVNVAEYRHAMASAAANEIHRLLSLSQQGEVQLENEQGSRSLQAKDVAVLVRTGREGAMVKALLAERGIASVYLSNRDSVFLSTIAADILRLLDAILEPENERKLKSALASGLFDASLLTLQSYRHDEWEWELCVNEFKEYQKLWFERGVQPMLRAVLYKRNLAKRWLNEASGERLITDYLHLAELLQQAQTELDSEFALLRWLNQQLEDAMLGQAPGDEQIQRLESEQNLVQIITIHKSKGLEYPIVFAPFVLDYREAKAGRYFDETTNQTMLDFAPDKEVLSKADRERLAEDLRLLYVAVTRAVFAVYIGCAPLRKSRARGKITSAHLSAFGYLAQDAKEMDAQEMRTALTLLCQTKAMVVESLPDALEHPYEAEQTVSKTLSASRLSHSIDRRWRVTSYSNLAHSSHSVDATLEVAGFDVDSLTERDERDGEELLSIFSFPKGAQPGTFLHSVFENIDFELPLNASSLEQIQQQMVLANIEDKWFDVIVQMVNQVLSVCLDSDELQLSAIPAKSRLVEMEFLFPITSINAAHLTRISQQYDQLSAQAGELTFHDVEGMLKGFIDLVFEYRGRFYVLDWKSNHLGNDSSFYQPEALEQAMIAHRYDLQYQIYTLALHRFLSSRIKGYDYDKHIGGVFYIFLRGVNVAHGQSGVFYTCPQRAHIEALDGYFRGETGQLGENQQMDLGL